MTYRDPMGKLSSIALIVLTVAIAIVTGAIVVQELNEDTEYTVTYDLGGGENNPLNPVEYMKGDSIPLYSATSGDLYFKGWYLDPAMTTRCDAISPDMEGDIVLYARWSDNLEGKGFDMRIEGRGQEMFIPYTVDGTSSRTYLYYNPDAGNYYINSKTTLNKTYSLGSTDTVTSDQDSWTGMGGSGESWTLVGEETIQTASGWKTCELWSIVYQNGAQERQWIGDGWILYKCTYDYETFWESEHYTYTFTGEFIVDVDNEYDVTGYGDHGIEVVGSGTYAPGQEVVLTAVCDDPSTFTGWFDEGGRLLTDGLSCTLVAGGDDIRVFAMNGTDPDMTVGTGDAFRIGSEMDSCEITVVDDTLGTVMSLPHTGDGSVSIPGGGLYTVFVDGYVDGSEVHRFSTVRVMGDVVREFTWEHGGETYNLSFSMDYSDVEAYRGAYSVDLREQDVNGNHARDRTFITYSDETIVRLASDLRELGREMGELEYAEFVLKFTQWIEYQDDATHMGYEEYWKFPLETLFDMGGDCEDTSILFCAIMKASGYDDVALLILPGHAAGAVSVECDGQPIVYDGCEYRYCETTHHDYSVGEVPQSMNGASVTVVAV